MVEKDVIHTEDIWQITGKTRCVIDQKAVERLWFGLRGSHQRIQSISTGNGRGRPRLITAHKLLDDDPPLFRSKLSATPNLIFDRGRALQIRREPSIDSASHGCFLYGRV